MVVCAGFAYCTVVLIVLLSVVCVLMVIVNSVGMIYGYGSRLYLFVVIVGVVGLLFVLFLFISYDCLLCCFGCWLLVFCLVFVVVGFWVFAGFVFCGLFDYVLWLLFANCVVGFGVVWLLLSVGLFVCCL